MREYLEGYHFTVLSDHLALKWLEKMDNPSVRLARWAMELWQWDFEVKYRKGTENLVADALLRQPVETCALKRNPNLECISAGYKTSKTTRPTTQNTVSKTAAS